MSAGDFKSLRMLAAAIGLSHTAVGKWLKDSRWPFPRVAPWPRSLLPKIKAWQANNLADDPARPRDNDDFPTDISQLGVERKAKIAKTIVQTRVVQFDLEKKKGLYHLVDECSRHKLRQIHAVKQEFGSMSDRMPIDTPPATREWVRLEVERICNAFAAAAMNTQR